MFKEKVAYYERDAAQKNEIIRRLEDRLCYLERVHIDTMSIPVQAYAYAPPMGQLHSAPCYTEKDLPVIPLYPQQSG